jgi:hypothetical protein
MSNELRPLVTFDLDGVLVGGEYIPIGLREQASLYAQLPPLTTRGLKILKRLIEERRTRVGIVTARGFEDAAAVSYEWLDRHGVPAYKLEFIRTHTNGTGGKGDVLMEIGPDVHFDDRWEVVYDAPGVADPWVAALADRPERMWDHIERVLHTNGWIGPIQGRFRYEEGESIYIG